MGHVPDAAAATSAVAALYEQITDAYRSATTEGGPDVDPADAPDWGQLAGAVVELDAQVRWMRDAVLVLARRAGVTWPRLEGETGVPDATLSNRARRRLEKDQ